MDHKDAKCLLLLKECIKNELNYFQQFNPILDDKFLLHFIRGRKYKVEVAFETLKKYLHIRRSKYPETFLELLPSTIRIKEDCIRILRHSSPTGHTVVLTRVAWWPPIDSPQSNDLGWEHIIPKFVLAVEGILAWKNVDDMGLEFVVDLEGFNLKHLKRLFRVQSLIKFINIFYKASPLRVKKIFFLNASFAFNVMFSSIKQLDVGGILHRVLMDHGKLEAFHTHLPPTILPQCLNGQLSIQEAMDEKFDQHVKNEEFFQLMQKCLQHKI